MTTNLDAETRPGCKALHPQLDREVAWGAPAQAIVQTLHHHGAWGAAVVAVETDRVDQHDGALLLIRHHWAQVKAILQRTVIHYERGGRPGGP